MTSLKSIILAQLFYNATEMIISQKKKNEYKNPRRR